MGSISSCVLAASGLTSGRRPIAPGQHVHVHNMAFGDLSREGEVGADVRPVEPVLPQASFGGIVRDDGRVAMTCSLPAVPA
jgi:hypothetical protein